eukprot:89955-Pyramimonas_sp.AAC.1
MKAFDSIAPERLLAAWKRFGVKDSMILAVAEIYSECQFTVVEDGVESCPRQQRADISQGCP